VKLLYVQTLFKFNAASHLYNIHKQDTTGVPTYTLKENGMITFFSTLTDLSALHSIQPMVTKVFLGYACHCSFKQVSGKCELVPPDTHDSFLKHYTLHIHKQKFCHLFCLTVKYVLLFLEKKRIRVKMVAFWGTQRSSLEVVDVSEVHTVSVRRAMKNRM
jgi:hypothetical protein